MVGSAQKEVISLSHKYFYVIEQKKNPKQRQNLGI